MKRGKEAQQKIAEVLVGKSNARDPAPDMMQPNLRDFLKPGQRAHLSGSLALLLSGTVVDSKGETLAELSILRKDNACTTLAWTLAGDDDVLIDRADAFINDTQHLA
ncbi:hypothetical protein LTR10_007130 [Elasticomyces elasticus]|nr:hypothetical protein LTR10_007130 [Elasticomyces elasticus]KAK4978947.1 hypothetical protein LTR42_001447 [Elasticomyces elasticus]